MKSKIRDEGDRDSTELGDCLKQTVNAYAESVALKIASTICEEQKEDYLPNIYIRIFSVHDEDSETEGMLGGSPEVYNVFEPQIQLVQEACICPRQLPERMKIADNWASLQQKDHQQTKQEQSSWKEKIKQESKANCISFKRSHKPHKSQLTKKGKAFREHQSNLIESRHNQQNQGSLVFGACKGTSGYSQMRDKMLVQYFYPKQKKVLNFSSEKEKQEGQEHHQKVFVKSKSEKKYNLSRLLRANQKKSFETINDIGRRAQFSDYDIISCQSSLSPLKINRQMLNVLHERPEISRDTGEMTDPDLRKSEVQVLRKRMLNLESKVWRKMPYLVKMGVKFRRVVVKK